MATAPLALLVHVISGACSRAGPGAYECAFPSADQTSGPGSNRCADPYSFSGFGLARLWIMPVMTPMTTDRKPGRRQDQDK